MTYIDLLKRNYVYLKKLIQKKLKIKKTASKKGKSRKLKTTKLSYRHLLLKNLNVKNIPNLVFVLIFILLLIIPSLFHNREEKKESKYEKRYLSSFPSVFNDEGKLNNKFFNEFDDWAGDRLWNRDNMIHMYSQMMYNYFSLIRKDSKFIIGKDKEEYFATDLILDNYSGRDYLDDKTKELGKEFLISFRDICKYCNASFYYIPLLDKEAIIPENFPKSINKINEKNDYDEFIEKVQNETDINVYYPKDFLFESKLKYKVFPRTGDVTHWTDRGAYVTYIDFMNYLSKKEKFNFIKLNTNRFNIKMEEVNPEYYGGISDPELVEVLKLNHKDTEEIDKLFDEDEEVNTFEKVRFKHTKLKDGRKLLIVGDSYINYYWLKYMPESFTDTVFLSFKRLDLFPKAIYEFKPDIVLFENASREFFLSIENFENHADFMEVIANALKESMTEE